MVVQVLDVFGVNFICHAFLDLDIRGVEAQLPAIGDGQDHIPADEFAPVQVITISCRQQARAIAAFLIDSVGFLDASNAGPFQGFWVHDDIIAFANHFHPVIHAPDHDGAHRRHEGGVMTVRFAASQPTLNSFGNHDCLWNGEAYGSVDIDTVISGFFNRFDTGFCGRNLDLYVGGQRVKMDSLGGDGFGVAVKDWVGPGSTACLFCRLRVQTRGKAGRLLFGPSVQLTAR